MEINKLNFDLFKANIINTFEELDVNADGKITEADKDIAENNEIKNAIEQLLASQTDDDPELNLNPDKETPNTQNETKTTDNETLWLEKPTEADLKKALKLPDDYIIEIKQSENLCNFDIYDKTHTYISSGNLTKNDDGSFNIKTNNYGIWSENYNVKYTKDGIRMFNEKDLINSVIKTTVGNAPLVTSSVTITYEEKDNLYKFEIYTNYGKVAGEIIYTDSGSQIFIKENSIFGASTPGVDGATGLLIFDKNGNRITEKPQNKEMPNETNLARLMGIASNIKFEVTARDESGRITEFKLAEESSYWAENDFKLTITYDNDGGFKISTNAKQTYGGLKIPENSEYDPNGYKILTEEDIFNKLGNFVQKYGYNAKNMINVTNRDEFGKITAFEVIPNNSYNKYQTLKFTIDYNGDFINISPSFEKGKKEYYYTQSILLNNFGEDAGDKSEEYMKLAYGEKAAQEYTGTKGDKYYSKGALAKGYIDGLMYSDGIAVNDRYCGRVYFNGKVVNGLFNGKYYDSGVLRNGKINSIMYKNGVKFTGIKRENGFICKYQDGVLVRRY